MTSLEAAAVIGAHVDEYGLEVERIIGREEITIRAVGNVDLATVDILGNALQTAVCDAPNVLLDLAAVSFFDSTGVRALLQARQTADELGHSFHITNAQDWVARVLEVTGIGPMLDAGRPASPPYE